MYAPCDGQHEKHGTKHIAWLFSIASKLRVRCVNERFCCVSGLSRSADRSATCEWSASCMHAERPASKSSSKTHWMPVPRRWRPDTRPSAGLKHLSGWVLTPSLPCLGLFSGGLGQLSWIRDLCCPQKPLVSVTMTFHGRLVLQVQSNPEMLQTPNLFRVPDPPPRVWG